MENNSSQSISVGVIGTGGMGTRHAVNLHRFVGGAHVAGVYDLDQAHASQAAEQCGSAQVFSDPLQLINDPGVDAVLIASPDDTHTNLTLECLKVNKPVLCEKPLATRVEDAIKVLEVETSLSKRLISVGFMRRFDPQHAAVKSRVSSGELGEPLMWKGVHRNASVSYGISGATILTNSAGHDFDSARFLMDAEVLEVHVRGLKSRSELHDDTRDLLLIEMMMSKNRLASAEVYVNAEYGYEVSAEVICQQGTVVTQQPDKALMRSKSMRGFHVSSDWLSPFQDAYVAEAIDWIDSLQTGRLFGGASAWDGYAAMMITAACIESLHTNQYVAVQLGQKPDLYG